MTLTSLCDGLLQVYQPHLPVISCLLTLTSIEKAYCFLQIIMLLLRLLVTPLKVDMPQSDTVLAYVGFRAWREKKCILSSRRKLNGR